MAEERGWLANGLRVAGVVPGMLVVLLAGLLSPVAAGAQQSRLHAVEVPNRVSYWRDAGFVEMVPPVRLPTNLRDDDTIMVWVRIPPGRKITVRWVAEQKRYTLKFPPGTVADRVETGKNEQDAMQVVNGIGDVRGARIGEDGRMWFHVYEPVPGQPLSWLHGYEWLRMGTKADVEAGERLVALYFPHAGPKAHQEMRVFRVLNHCGACHQIDQAEDAKVSAHPSFEGMAFKPGEVNKMETDADGFFQPILVMKDSMGVVNIRPWDRNPDDPYITVWCGSDAVKAVTHGDHRGYACADGRVPVGKLDMAAALKHHDRHAEEVCAAREYVYKHMDAVGKQAFAREAAECGKR